MAQTVPVAAHAILQTSGLKAPLATETAIIFRAFPFAGLGHANGAENNQDSDNRSYVRSLHCSFLDLKMELLKPTSQPSADQNGLRQGLAGATETDAVCQIYVLEHQEQDGPKDKVC